MAGFTRECRRDESYDVDSGLTQTSWLQTEAGAFEKCWLDLNSEYLDLAVVQDLRFKLLGFSQ